MINVYWQTKFSKALSSWLNRRASLREHSGENQLQRVLETERKTELVRHAVETLKVGS